MAFINDQWMELEFLGFCKEPWKSIYRGNKMTIGLNAYYQGKIEHFEALLAEKTQNLRRLEAQRNKLNSQGITHNY